MTWIYFLFGVFIGWIIKIPFLYRWYKGLKRAGDYQKAREGVELYNMIEKYNELYPDNKIKH